MTVCCTEKASPGALKRPAARAWPVRAWPGRAPARPYDASAAIFQAILAAALTLCVAFSASAAAEPLRVVAFGDSLTAGLGLQGSSAFPAQLEKRLIEDGFEVKVTNAGVSGETTAGGLARIGYALQDGADLVILELGANDMLRGLDPKAARENLEKIIAASKAKGARVLLAGMVAGVNFGPDYKRAFDAIYPEIAKSHGLRLYPFFLEGVAGEETLVLDGLHPNSLGVARIVSGVAPLVEESLAELRAERAKAH